MRPGFIRIVSFAALSLVPFAIGFAMAEATSQTGRQPQFANGQVKVWKSLIFPNSPLPLHRHDHPRVIVALTGGRMEIHEQDGRSEIHDWRTGNAYWLPTNAPGTMHQDINVGDKPIEVMVVELETAS